MSVCPSIIWTPYLTKGCELNILANLGRIDLLTSSSPSTDYLLFGLHHFFIDSLDFQYGDWHIAYKYSFNMKSENKLKIIIFECSGTKWSSWKTCKNYIIDSEENDKVNCFLLLYIPYSAFTLTNMLLTWL